MDKKLVAIAPGASIKAAIKLVKAAGVNLLVVVEDGRLVGVVGE